MTRKPKKAAGMTRVDAFMVPNGQVEQYIADREKLAALAIQLMTPMCARVERCWSGSEDGEAVVGFNAAGEIITMIHLDPDGVKMLNNPEQLKAYLQP